MHCVTALPVPISPYHHHTAPRHRLHIWNLTDPTKPVCQSPPAACDVSASGTYPKYVTALSWNTNVPHILASCNCYGQTQILDLRKKRIAMRFESRNMDRIQAVSWNPGRKTQLAVSYCKGEAEIWDLKQPKSPKMYLRDQARGHTRSIWDISWNTLDANLLLTSGDDCLGNIWNGNTGELIHQIEFGDHPKLKVEWNNGRGGMLATMSTEKIALHHVELEVFSKIFVNHQFVLSD